MNQSTARFVAVKSPQEYFMAMKLKKNRTPMGMLLAKEPKFGAQLKAGELVEGTVLEKTGNVVYVDMPPCGVGIVFGKEYRDAKEIIRNLQKGATVVAKVVELENEDGYAELSLREAGAERRWEKLGGLKAANETIETPVIGANRGGLIVDVQSVQGFLPVSQLNAQHYPRIKDGDKNKILAELQKFIGENLSVKIITLNQKEEKLVVSEKEVELEALSGVLKQYRVGDIVEGEVSGVVDFGAFVRFRAALPDGSSGKAPEVLPGEPGAERTNEQGPELEGLIHISELDYKLITNPAEIVRVGEKVKAKIISMERGRVSLSLKRLKDDPWQDMGRRYQKGDLVEGKIIKLDRYGALVELSPGIHGLCHISEMGSPEEAEALNVGEAYPFRIIELKPEERRLMLGFLRRSSTAPDDFVQGRPGEERTQPDLALEKLAISPEALAPEMGESHQENL